VFDIFVSRPHPQPRARFAHPVSRRIFRTVCAVFLLIVCFGAARDAEAKAWFVQVGGQSLSFSPADMTIAPGDQVTFMNLGGVHNVVADDGSFRCAHGCDGTANGDGNASGSIWSATVSFGGPKIIGYFCEVHGSPGQGMFGTIRVVSNAPLIPAPTLGIAALMLLASTLIGVISWKRKRNC
jgi:plastocyanin